MERKLSSQSLKEKKLSTSAILVDESMFDTYHDMAVEIVHLVYEKNRQVVIGITGAPGSGKSTTAESIASLIPDCIVVPMDGFHYTKAHLSSMEDPTEAFKRRGAQWTFDGQRFVQALKDLKSHKSGKFPSFDHNKGDPIEEDIIVTPKHKVILVEGNYLLLDQDPWKEIKDILDFTYFMNCDLEVSNERLKNRHISVGRTPEEASERIESNDVLNAKLIQESMNRADKIIQSV
jgi:pantothenate kinase